MVPEMLQKSFSTECPLQNRHKARRRGCKNKQRFPAYEKFKVKWAHKRHVWQGQMDSVLCEKWLREESWHVNATAKSGWPGPPLSVLHTLLACLKGWGMAKALPHFWRSSSSPCSLPTLETKALDAVLHLPILSNIFPSEDSQNSIFTVSCILEWEVMSWDTRLRLHLQGFFGKQTGSHITVAPAPSQ